MNLCAVKDVCSQRIVGYSIGPRMTSQLADAALRTAIARRSPASTLVVHDDPLSPLNFAHGAISARRARTG